MTEIFHDQMSPSEFLLGWLTNDYLNSFPKEKADFENYYSGYMHGAFLRHTQNAYNHNLKSLISIVKNYSPKPLRILEIGCGCGTESLFLSLLGCDVVAVELMEKHFNVAEARKKVIEDKLGKPINIKFNNLSILDFNVIDNFDLIWMEQAFHHLEPRDSIVKKISSFLKPDGYLVISESNAYNPISQIALMRERFRTHKNPFKTIIEHYDEDGTKHLWGHERILRASKLAGLFAKEGIVKKEIDYFKILPNRAGLTLKRGDSKPFSDNNFTLWLDNFLHNKIPLLFKRFLTFSYNYVGIKTSNDPDYVNNNEKDRD